MENTINKKIRKENILKDITEISKNNLNDED